MDSTPDTQTRARTSLLLVRHGQTSWNVAGRWQGHADPGLTAAGRAQAGELAERLAGRVDRPWSRLFVSDLTRARETAILIATALGLPIEVDQRLRELDVGEWSGLTRGEIESRDRDRLLAFEAGDLAVRAGGGESRIELAERAQAFAAEIAVRFPDDHLIVVTHLGILRALAPGFEPENTAFTEILVPITPAPTTEPILRPGKASPL